MPHKCPEVRRAYQRMLYHKHKQLYGPRTRTPEQREKQRASQRVYDRKRSKNTYWKLKNRLRVRLKCALRARKYNGRAIKQSSTMTMLGCTPYQLRLHLQSRFKEGMTWRNYGKKWHIDHIIPCAFFNLTLAHEQRLCFHYSNLQPLWAKENMQKSDKIIVVASV